MRRALRWAGTAVIAIIVTSAAAPSPDDACSLLTKEDAAAALGEAVKGPKALSNLPAGPGSTVSSCEFEGSGLHKVQVNLTQLPQSSVAMYRAMCAKKEKDGLAGLGDVACWYNEKHEELHALKGAAFISVELRRSGNPTEAIKGVMKKALDRLR
jgi:hypothetical protein